MYSTTYPGRLAAGICCPVDVYCETESQDGVDGLRVKALGKASGVLLPTPFSYEGFCSIVEQNPSRDLAEAGPQSSSPKKRAPAIYVSSPIIPESWKTSRISSRVAPYFNAFRIWRRRPGS